MGSVMAAVMRAAWVLVFIAFFSVGSFVLGRCVYGAGGSCVWLGVLFSFLSLHPAAAASRVSRVIMVSPAVVSCAGGVIFRVPSGRVVIVVVVVLKFSQGRVFVFAVWV